MKAPLPGRTNIVVTRNPDYRRSGILVAADFAQALRLARERCREDGQSEIMVIGGAELYRLALAVATRLYVTLVDAEPEGDTYFPEVDCSQWREVSRETFAAENGASYPFAICVFERA